MSAPKLPKGPITADELVRLKEEMLRTDPEYRAKFEAVEAERRERVRVLTEAERPIVADLRAVGVEVDSVWDLVNTAEPYPDALPVLLDHLERDYPDRVREGIARALAVKPAAAFWDRLKALYVAPETGPNTAMGLAAALAVTATEQTFDDLVELIKDPRNRNRVLLLGELKRLGGPKGRSELEALVDDPMLGKEARHLLKSRKRRGR
ncbi:MAG: hypothetical protein U0904_08645 [Candidatus Nanopelagicales bacterium]|nr:hypothetical protein [Candidatus Nanopelagicales bacterium]